MKTLLLLTLGLSMVAGSLAVSAPVQQDSYLLADRSVYLHWRHPWERVDWSARPVGYGQTPIKSTLDEPHGWGAYPYSRAQKLWLYERRMQGSPPQRRHGWGAYPYAQDQGAKTPHRRFQGSQPRHRHGWEAYPACPC